MVKNLLSTLRLKRTTALAAVAIACLSFAPNTLVNATGFSHARPYMVAVQQANENWEVLTREDAALYQSIFSAQADGYTNEADKMIAHLQDRRLVGHVLAARYLKGTATLPELQAWLASYSDHPEASHIYAKAIKMAHGSSEGLTKPASAGAISGNGYGYTNGTGFRNGSASEAGLSSDDTKIMRQISTALKQNNKDEAKSLLAKATKHNTLPNKALAPLQSKLAAIYYYSGDNGGALKLTEASYMREDPRALWIEGLSFYKQGKYAAAAESFKLLASRNGSTDSDAAAAAFWTYRALAQTGSKAEAGRWLMKAAEEPKSFYGLLANSLKGHDVKTDWSWHLPSINNEDNKVLADYPAGQRALALVQIGQKELAEKELQRINARGKRGLQLAMLTLAEKNRMASLALKIGGMTVDGDGKPFDAALYPVPPWQPNEGYQLDRALLFALMRHESQFNPKAVSNQGACGLMQLMPTTAMGVSDVSFKHQKGAACPAQLFDPATNIGLGQRYVRSLADMPIIGDNLLLLLAAYNGGPARVAGMDNLATSDPLLFIESMPVRETHDYVQQVLMQYWIYCARLHQPLTSLDQLAHGKWPHYLLHETSPVREAAAHTTLQPGFTLARNMISY